MPDRPHIILFNPDQWRGDVLGHMGNPAAVTPHLDRMVRSDSVSFRHASCQLPVCTPSRCAFMTGWYPHVCGHRTQLHMLRPDEPVMLKTLKDHGYHVWWGGKNDLVPAQHGFGHVCNVKNEIPPPPFTPTPPTYRGSPQGDTYYSQFVGQVAADATHPAASRDYRDEAHLQAAIDYILQYEGDQPLCLFLATNAPHPPYGVGEPWLNMIDRSRLPPRRPMPAVDSGKASIIRHMAQRTGMETWSESRFDKLRAIYYGMCARVDDMFGRLVAALRQAGMYDDSAIFFFSDHGDFTGDYDLPNKAHNVLDDNLTQVPLVIKPPRSRPAKPGVTDAIAELIDLPATVFDLTNIEPDWDHFGQSLMHVVTGQSDEHRDAAFCEGGRRPNEVNWDQFHFQAQGKASVCWPAISVQAENLSGTGKATMCRTRKYKYVHRLDDVDELYDLQADPLESTSLIDEPALADVKAWFERRLMHFYLETTDVTPRDLDKRR